MSESSGKSCKNYKKIFKNCTCIKKPQPITLTSILGHLGLIGGHLEGQNLQGGVVGFFSFPMMIFLLPWLSLGHKNTVGVVVRIVIDYPYLSPHPTIGQCMELPEISPVPDWCHTSPSITNSELCEPEKKNSPLLKTLVPRPISCGSLVGDPD